MAEANYATTAVGSALAKDMPLTAELKDRAELAVSTANRIHNTLHQLRDRLIGPPPPGAPTAGDAPSPYCFADAMRGVQSELLDRLQQIEELADVLSARL